jgi:PTH1 family peptidyl-tRNA hydrolase
VPFPPVSNNSPIRLIAGLGNPGEKYANTRHNAGFWFADAVASKYHASFREQSRFHGMAAQVNVGGNECWLLKPATYMNRSGQAVGALCHYYKIKPEEVLVVHDELDLDPGVIRLKSGGGHGGHNGLRDLHQVLGPHYQRLRVGIGHPGNKSQVVNYVLKPPTKDDAIEIERALDRALDELPAIIAGDMAQAMNRLHQV